MTMLTLGTNHAPAGLPIALEKPKKRSTVPATPPPGRPTVMTPDVLRKLEDAFMNAFTDEMACLYAGISKTTLYEYCKDNKDFAERKEELKITPHLAAQKELVEGIKGNLGQARWFAEHRMPDYTPKTKVEHAGKIEMSSTPISEEQRAIAAEYEEKLRKSIVDGAKDKP